MRAAAKELEFERAAALRDEIQQIRLRVLEEDQSAISARAARARGQRTPSRPGGGAADGRGRRARHAEPVAPALEVSSVTVMPAEEPSRRPADPTTAEGTPSDWLPGIRDEHEDARAGRRAGWTARPGTARVTPNIRKRTGHAAARRR